MAQYAPECGVLVGLVLAFIACAWVGERRGWWGGIESLRLCGACNVFKRRTRTKSDASEKNLAHSGDAYNRRLRRDTQCLHLSTKSGAKAAAGLAWFRIAVFLYVTTINVWSFSQDGGAAELRFFTVWNYCLVNVVFALGAAVSLLSRAATPCCCSANNNADETSLWDTLSGNREPSVADAHKALRAAFNVVAKIELGHCILVTLVYWIALRPGEGKLSAHNEFMTVNKHALNSVFMLAEFAFGRVLIRASDAYAHFGFLMTYAAFALVYQHIAGGSPIYFFLNTKKAAIFLWLFAIVAFSGILFILWVLASRRKEKMLAQRASRYDERTRTSTPPLAPAHVGPVIADFDFHDDLDGETYTTPPLAPADPAAAHTASTV